MAEEALAKHVELRSGIEEFLKRDLFGPGEADEVLEVAPLDRYVTGILYPQLAGHRPIPLEPEAQDDTPDDDGDAPADPAVAMSNVQYPSSAGVTFAVRPDVVAVEAQVSVAKYEPDEDRWHRVPLGPLLQRIDIRETRVQVVPLSDGLELYCNARDQLRGARSITVVLKNTQTAEPGRKDAKSFFQTQLTVSGVDGADPPFVARPEKLDVADEDLETNALLYRNQPEYAIGHGCAADWETSENSGEIARVIGTFIPGYDVPLLESNPVIPKRFDLGFDRLATEDRLDVASSLEAFMSGYLEWVEARQADAAALDESLRATADKHLAECRRAHGRIVGAIELLRSDPDVFRAFQLANRAIADQMERAAEIEGEKVDRARLGWRPFQLAFILMAIPSVVDPNHPDRETADLLWFPTGGGKTEAYLGLFAFAAFHRRISSGEGGVTAIMRYTLRLLTSQQFERAARVVCACELVRRDADDLGDEPISVGLFVGRAGSPNKVEEAKDALRRLRADQPVPTANPCQLRTCPWCDESLVTKGYTIRTNPDRLQIVCPNAECLFSELLPVHVVDSDLYRARPTLVIGTVDKFAALPWRPEVGNLINVGDSPAPPPELIIQDELHLISGPLGTMTGLYETVIDVACRQRGSVPKVVASTATIRRAQAQAKGLFGRSMQQFPPPGIDPGDSWFATTAPPDRVGARRYLGLMAPGVSHAMLMIRTYAALLHEAWMHRDDEAIDPYWTLVGYFNSLRVLGAARMLVASTLR